MSDLHTMTDEELGRSLTALAGRPRVAEHPRCVGRGRGDDPRGTSRAVARRAAAVAAEPAPDGLVLVVAAVLALAGVALAARLVFHLGAIGIEIIDGPPTSLPSNVVDRRRPGARGLVRQATRVAGFAPALPEALGPPDRLWVDETEIDLESGEVAEAHRRRVGAHPGAPRDRRNGHGSAV